MLCGLAAFVGLDWSRAPLWLPALVAGALGFAALGGGARRGRSRSPRRLAARAVAGPAAGLPSRWCARLGVAGALRRHPVTCGEVPFKPASRALDAATSAGASGAPAAALLARTA